MAPPTLLTRAQLQGFAGKEIQLVKVNIVGSQQSNVIQDPTTAEGSTFTNAGAITPPYDLSTLAELFEGSSNLRPCIDTYVTNIDGFGHHFEAVIDVKKRDADQKIADLLKAERRRLVSDPQRRLDKDVIDMPETPAAAAIAARRDQIAAEMAEEKLRLDSFFANCNPDMSFVALRRQTRYDKEILGNAYWEVLRNAAGDIVRLIQVPAFTVRLLKLDSFRTPVTRYVKAPDHTWQPVIEQRYLRRYVQVFNTMPISSITVAGDGLSIVYFKEFVDQRWVSRDTGRIYANEAEMMKAEPKAVPATELVHFRLPNPKSPYGLPRWSGALLAVLGTRQAEEVNFLYFDNKGIPPYIMMVSGAKLTEDTINRIESYIGSEIKGREGFHKMLIVEAESPQGAVNADSGKMKIEVKSLMDAQHKDALFMGYMDRNEHQVGRAFRLPPLLRGDTKDFNRACYSADTETLTENGWKHHEEIAADERIAVFRPETGAMSFEVPKQKLVYQVKETLIHFRGAGTDVLVTPDHKMLARCPDRGWQVEEARETAARGSFELRCAPDVDTSGARLESFALPKTCQIERGHTHEPIPGDLWVEFLGYFCSDGGLLTTEHPTAPYLVFVRQKKQPYLDRMRACLDQIGWAYSTQVKDDGCSVFTISNRCLRAWLRQHCGDKSGDRRLPDSYVTGLPAGQLGILWEALKAGDGGHGKTASNGAYYSGSKALIDQAQTICLRLGLRSHYRWSNGAGVFRLSWAARKTSMLSARDHVEMVPYEGSVYCFECPGAGFFVTRRNAKVAIQGNTADSALQYADQQVLGPERDEFDWFMDQHILSAMRIRWWEFVSNGPSMRDPDRQSVIVERLLRVGAIDKAIGRTEAADILGHELPPIDQEQDEVDAAGGAGAPARAAAADGPAAMKLQRLAAQLLGEDDADDAGEEGVDAQP